MGLGLPPRLGKWEGNHRMCIGYGDPITVHGRQILDATTIALSIVVPLGIGFALFIVLE